MFLQEFEQQQQLRLKKTKIGSKISNPWQDQFFIELGCEKLVLTWHTISLMVLLSRESGLFSKQLINSRDEGSWKGEVGRLNAHPDSRHVVLILVVCMSKNSCVPLMKDL